MGRVHPRRQKKNSSVQGQMIFCWRRFLKKKHKRHHNLWLAHVLFRDLHIITRVRVCVSLKFFCLTAIVSFAFCCLKTLSDSFAQQHVWSRWRRVPTSPTGASFLETRAHTHKKKPSINRARQRLLGAKVKQTAPPTRRRRTRTWWASRRSAAGCATPAASSGWLCRRRRRGT